MPLTSSRFHLHPANCRIPVGLTADPAGLDTASEGFRDLGRAPALPVGAQKGEPTPEALQRWSVAAAAAGRAALRGEPGPPRNALILSAASMLLHLRRVDSLAAGGRTVAATLDDGSALAHFEAAT